MKRPRMGIVYVVVAVGSVADLAEDADLDALVAMLEPLVAHAVTEPSLADRITHHLLERVSS